MGGTSGGWRKSTFSDQSDCVEVKFSTGQVMVRNSRRPEAVPLAFPLDRWNDFISGIASGEFFPTRSRK